MRLSDHPGRSRLIALGMILAGAALAGGATAAPAPTAPAKAAVAAARPVNLTGYWKLKSRGTMASPPLTAWAKTEAAKVKTDGDMDLEAAKWCVFQGMPYVMDNAGPIEIRRAPTEIVVVADRLAPPRHIYTTMKTHPSEDVFDHTVLGNSLGRWVGSTLSVDTTGFSAGVGPAGAPRTETAHLVEQFRLTDGGQTLSVTSTWTDPKVFTRPYSYTWTYERLPKGYTPEEYYCDPRENGVGHK